MITFTGVSKYFPEGDTALSDIHLHIEKGSATALLGDQGSGKSTLLRLVNRMAEPSEGLVEVGGVDVSRVPVEEHRHKIGFVLPGGGLVPNFSVQRNLELSPGLAPLPASRRKERIERMLDILQLNPKLYPPALSRLDRLRVSPGQHRPYLVPPFFEARDPALHLGQKDLQDGPQGRLLVFPAEHGTDLLQREAHRLQLLDAVQPQQVAGGVEPVAGLRALGLFEEPDPLVVAHRFGRHTNQLCYLPDP